MEGVSKKYMKYNKIFIFVLVFIIGFLIGSFGYTKFINNKNIKNDNLVNLESEETKDLYDNSNDIKNDDKINVVLLGQGGGGHSGGGLSDSIILVSIDPLNKKIGLISIPRDFYFYNHKINSDPSIKDAVASITGYSVPDYIAIDFTGFTKLIDNLGGIEVDVKKSYVDYFYPVKGLENETCGKSADEIYSLHQKYSGFELEKNFICRYEKIEYGIGISKMGGESALKYVRSRHGDSDFGRSRRQFEVLAALSKKAKLQDLDMVIGIVETSLSKSKIKSIISKIGNLLDYKIREIQLTDSNVLLSSKSFGGAYILIPKEGENNFSGIRNYINKNF